MSPLVLAACQPLPPGVMAEFRPGHAVFACPPATSWWTLQHAALTAVAAVWAVIILAVLAALIRRNYLRHVRGYEREAA